jgi:hypothetical protein
MTLTLPLNQGESSLPSASSTSLSYETLLDCRPHLSTAVVKADPKLNLCFSSLQERDSLYHAYARTRELVAVLSTSSRFGRFFRFELKNRTRIPAVVAHCPDSFCNLVQVNTNVHLVHPLVEYSDVGTHVVRAFHVRADFF